MARIYKDTRVDLRPYSPNSVVNVRIPAEANTLGRARFSTSPLTKPDDSIARDEDEFSKRYLITQGSVYFRKRSVYPRTFLWRVVDDSKVLEIQCVDLTKAGIEHHEYNVTLRLDFKEEILPYIKGKLISFYIKFKDVKYTSKWLEILDFDKLSIQS